MNLVSSNKIYINVSDGSDNDVVFNPLVNSGTSSDFQLSSDTFYGKMLDDENGLANIKVIINGNTIAQDASFNGYDTTTANNDTFNNVTNTSSAQSSDDNQFDFVDISTDDIYVNNVDNDDKGFRLKGNVVMNSIQRKDITSLFGSANNAPKSIKYEYRRDTRIGGVNNTTTEPFELYVDNFSLQPLITVNKAPGIVVTSIIYNMGIPSVHKFNIEFNTSSSGDTSRKYTQMNSTYKFVRGDLKIADITIEGISPYPNINKNDTQNISLTSTNEISDTRVGEYTLSNTNFALSITPYYQNIQYSSSRLTLGNLLTISEQTYSLTTGNSGKTEPSTDLSMNHFCDRDSFSSFEGSNPTTNAPSNLYQISDISELGGDMSQFTPVAYADHTIKVKDSTLLFINNKFKQTQINYIQIYHHVPIREV